LYEAIAASRLYEQIVEQIGRSITQGQLKPGDQLPPERELAQRFGVSRTAVREAMKALAEKGFIESQHGRGTFVVDRAARTPRQSIDHVIWLNGGQPDGTIHLVEVRALLEPAIAARAAARADAKDLAALREAFVAMDRAHEDANAFIEADLDFHLALAVAAGNPVVLALIDSIVALLREHRLRMFWVEGGPQRGQHHHRRILEAVERRDQEGARRAMEAHLKQVADDMKRAPGADHE
jgi:GntR family transcriptional regulator, transcriptional repressor for pyruvate dehydrogenase complex